jgi:CHAT domain-containing protein
LLNQAGLLAFGARDLNMAESDFQETVAIAERAHLPRMQAEGFLNLSDVYVQRKDMTKAETALDSAIAQVRQVQQDLDLPVYLARKADIEANRGNLRDADLLYDQASEMIEAMLINTPTSRHKVSMIAALSDIYVGHFRLAVSQLHDDTKAFEIIETARGRALADSMRYARGSPASAGTSAAEQQIAAVQKRLRESPVSPSETKVLLARLDRLYDEQLAPVEYERSRAEMRIASRPPVSIPILQRSLAQGEVLVEYVLDSSGGSHALEITHTTVRMHTVPGRAEVNDLCQKYLSAVKAKGNWLEPARDLFERVVQPAISGQQASVVIVPDGPLNLIPFAALPDRNGQMFGSSTIVSLAPSATVFEMLRTERRKVEPTKPFLGVAYSPGGLQADPDSQHSASRSVDSGLANLQPLQFAREEVQAGARAAGNGSVLLVDKAATESALKSETLGDFKVIHLAMHGFGDTIDPERAGLVLAPGDPNEDGLWQAREIRESRIAADLVTLSACETGVGKLQGEEGIMNLGRTFLVAGAKSVVASLWDADDRATATLMTHFYQQIAAGKTIAEALRDAQFGMLTEFGSDMPPYFWAGFTVIGDGNRKISFAKTNLPVGEAAKADIR